MASVQDSGFTKFETMLGLSVVLIAALAAIPYVQQQQSLETPVRALLGAEDIAHAVLDYRTDTDTWPLNADGSVDLAKLTNSQRPANGRTRSVSVHGAEPQFLVGAMAGDARDGTSSAAIDGQMFPAWLDEVPLDPWRRPYKVVVLGEPEIRDISTDGTNSGYPSTPPAGMAIVVMSAGQNGTWETGLTELWDADLALRLGRDDPNDTPLRGDIFGGDDLGFVLSRLNIGD